MKVTLNKVLQGVPALSGSLSSQYLDFEVSNITADSREVQAGTVFVAVRGGAVDGHQYIQDADQKGAALIIGEDWNSFETPSGRPFLQTTDSRLVLEKLAANFYRNPSHEMMMIGVTGTSGKTTVTYLLEAIFRAAGHRVGVIGTVNFRYEGQVFPSTHTTPGPVELHQLLARMKNEGCTVVIMEVSSHALKQKRVASVAFDGTLFTNLSPEHLDYHADMEDYYQSKAMLFRDLVDSALEARKKPVGVISSEDAFGQRLLRELEANPTPGYRFRGFQTDGLEFSIQGVRGRVEDVNVQSPLIGPFNGANLAAAVTLSRELGISPEAISKGIVELVGVPGRLESVANKRGVHLWVDYAHKPDALRKVIQALRDVEPKGSRLITVFGCGGDRDRKKRPDMGKIAVQGSDWVWITSDNPRTEEPQTIIDEILKGVVGFQNYSVEVDREKAIYQAIEMSRPGDLILVAGKGHENYQILGTRKIHFDDREVALRAFRALDTSGA